MKKALLICLLITSTIKAQNTFDLSYYLPQDISYNKNIPTPESVIGKPTTGRKRAIFPP